MDVYSLMGYPSKERKNIIELIQMPTNDQPLPIGVLVLVEEEHFVAAISKGDAGRPHTIEVFIPCMIPIDEEVIPRIAFSGITEASSLAPNDSSCLLKDSSIYDADLHPDLLNIDFVLEELRKKRMCSFICTPNHST